MSADAGTPERVRYRIGQAVRQLLRLAPSVHLELADRVGVGVTDLLALDHTTSDPQPLGVVELGERLGIRSASATVLVDRLEATGHLRRAPHPSDRRRTSLHPTDTAHQDVLAALEPLVRDIVHITDELDDPTAAAVLRFLTEVNAALTEFVHAKPAAPPTAPHGTVTRAPHQE